MLSLKESEPTQKEYTDDDTGSVREAYEKKTYLPHPLYEEYDNDFNDHRNYLNHKKK